MQYIEIYVLHITSFYVSLKTCLKTSFHSTMNRQYGNYESRNRSGNVNS